jgi:hypothetical protein
LFLLFQLIFLSHPRFIAKVVAPPIGAACFPGLITGTNQDLVISDAEVNMTTLLQPKPPGYRCDISLEVTLNLTNPYNFETDLYLLYNPAWGSKSKTVTGSFPEWSLDGDYVALRNSTFYNLTHPRQLPEEFHDRFPSWVWVHDVIWYDTCNFTLVNLTLESRENRLFLFRDSFRVDTYDIDYFEAGFGFSAGQIQYDRTIITMRIEMLQSAQYYRVSFIPDDTVSVTHDGENYVGEWFLEYPYPVEMLYGVVPEPIRGGCEGYILIHQVNYPPTIDYTIPTTSEASHTVPSDAIQMIFATLVSVTIIAFVAVLVHYSKRD